ncbi:hypothetical protein H7F33_07950 [Pedobacter sp. PAMC26386]|nr:hypothetical protein H7F33_07950 [Pedobacter sp. PAMC26386]
MKKNLLILAALSCSALIVMYILVKGAEPDRIVTNFKRDYHKYQLIPVDTALFPGRVSIMKAARGNVYGYVYNKNSIFRYNTLSHKLDTLISKKDLPISMVTRLEIDTATRTFYIFDDSGSKIITYQPDEKKVTPVHNSFLVSEYDTTKKIMQLKLKSFLLKKTDTLLYQFPFFKDGGLSADGFFIRNVASRYHFYIPFYNSGIIRYDELLNKISFLNTIDQTKASNIAVTAGNIYTRSSKSIVINSTATADPKHLYVLSYVLSEDAITSGYRGPVVDVYSTVSGGYEGSFKLPGYQNKPVLQLAMYSDTLVAAYENNILIFKLTSL